MLSAVSSALSGIRSSVASFDAGAARIASLPGSSAADDPDPSPTDTASELVQMTVAQHAFDANVAVLRTALNMQKFTFERWG